MPQRDFIEKSYRNHDEHYLQYASGEPGHEHARTWLEEDNIDAWRHLRMYMCLDPLLEAWPESRWLTVGDGRFGTDAQYILSKGVHAVATDISDVLLKEAHQEGLLEDFSRQNAESLTYDDGEFNFILCKESYHHFPRPMTALYEMLRVAGKGVILIEPTDERATTTCRQSLFLTLRDFVRGIMGKPRPRHLFEETGNYMYGITRREMEKAALGLNLRTVAFKGINDYFVEGANLEKTDSGNRTLARIKRRIALHNMFCRLGLKEYILLTTVIFKEKLDGETRGLLERSGYQVLELPENPHIEDPSSPGS